MVSIIVPVYNVSKQLPVCLSAIKAQTYTDFEALLVDDGSKDNSGAICDKYAADDPRFHVFHIPNGGCSHARNFGLDRAKGDYICFIDSDDFPETDYLSTLLCVLQETGADIACCSYTNVDASYKPIESNIVHTANRMEYTCDELFVKLFSKDFVKFCVAWNKLYTREIIGQERFKEGILSEDEEFIQRIYLSVNKLVYIDASLYYYVYNESSITHDPQKKQKFLEDSCDNFYERFMLLKDANKASLLPLALNKWFTHSIDLYSLLAKKAVIARAFIKKTKLRYAELRKYVKPALSKRIYYRFFLLMPSLVCELRNIKNTKTAS